MMYVAVVPPQVMGDGQVGFLLHQPSFLTEDTADERLKLFFVVPDDESTMAPLIEEINNVVEPFDESFNVMMIVCVVGSQEDSNMIQRRLSYELSGHVCRKVELYLDEYTPEEQARGEPVMVITRPEEGLNDFFMDIRTRPSN